MQQLYVRPPVRHEIPTKFAHNPTIEVRDGSMVLAMLDLLPKNANEKTTYSLPERSEPLGGSKCGFGSGSTP